MGNCKNIHKSFELLSLDVWMNQSQGHWLLFDVLAMSINLALVLEVEMGHVIDFLMSLTLRFSSFKKTCEFKLLKWSNLFCKFWKFMIHIRLTICSPLYFILIWSCCKIWKIMWNVGIIFILFLSMM